MIPTGIYGSIRQKKPVHEGERRESALLRSRQERAGFFPWEKGWGGEFLQGSHKHHTVSIGKKTSDLQQVKEPVASDSARMRNQGGGPTAIKTGDGKDPNW